MTWVSGRCEDGDVKEEKDKEIKGCRVVEGDKQGQGPKWRTKSKVEEGRDVRRDWMNEIALPLFSKQPSPDWSI